MAGYCVRRAGLMWGSLTKACGSSLELEAVDVDAFWAACRMAVRNIVCRCLLISEEFVVVSDDNDDTYTRGVVTISTVQRGVPLVTGKTGHWGQSEMDHMELMMELPVHCMDPRPFRGCSIR